MLFRWAIIISLDVNNNMNISFQASTLIIMLEDLNQFPFILSEVNFQTSHTHTKYTYVPYAIHRRTPPFQSDFDFPTCVSTSNIIYFIIMMISNVNKINIPNNTRPDIIALWMRNGCSMVVDGTKKITYALCIAIV